MIHDINIFMKHPYPDAQIYHDPVDPDEPEGAAIGYVKASEIATFFKISPNQMRSLIAEAWLDVAMDDELYNQFFYYKPRHGEDLLLCYLACERLLPMVPKRARAKWERMLFEMYAIDTDGGDYITKDATSEEIRIWHQQQDVMFDAWERNTKEGRQLKQELDISIPAFYEENGSSIRVLMNAVTHRVIETIATVRSEHLLLAEGTHA